MANRKPDLEELKADLATAQEELESVKNTGADPQSRSYRNAEDVVRILQRKVDALDYSQKRREEEAKKVETMRPDELADYVSPRYDV
jgi:hypothetical protein